MKSSRISHKLAHALTWRLRALGKSLTSNKLEFLPVLKELRAVTGRDTRGLARDLFEASRTYGVSAHDFANLMLWEIPKERWHDYIVGEDLDRFLQKTLDPDDRLLSRDKAGFAQVDRSKGLPWLPTLAVIQRLEGIPIEGAAVVSTPEELWASLATLRQELAEERDLVVKPSCGERGRGFFRVAPGGDIHDGEGNEVNRDDFARAVLHYTHPRGNYGYLVQEALVPHPDIVALTGIDALTSVRVVTALRDGRPHVIESFLKVPGPGRLTDNFLSGSKGTTIARFDPDTGQLGDLVGLLRPGFRHALERTATHPATGRRVAGQTLPFWREATEIAYRAAGEHPRTVAIGWDIAIATSGCVILDGNPNWGPGWQPCDPEGVRPRLARLYPHDFR